MTRISFCLLIALAAPAAAPALAQDRVPTFKEAVKESIRMAPLRVNVGMNFFLPGPTDDSKEAVAIRERARRMIYELAVRECTIAKQTFGEDCRLESVNVNINVNRQGPHMPDGHNINGNIALQITRSQ